MALIHDVTLAANEALGKIPALARQARSYASHPQMLRAKGIARSVASSAYAHRTGAYIGAGVGAAAGAGADYYNNPRASARSMGSAALRGGLMGGGLGLAGSYGRSAYKSMGGMSGIRSAATSRFNSGVSGARGWWAGKVAEARATKGI